MMERARAFVMQLRRVQYPFEASTRSIIYQQLYGNEAAVIHI
jgi:hypothetical protein